jgi:ABC-2 type transport system permease protein
MAGSAVLTGHVVASVARNILSTVIVISVALLAGFRPTGDPLRWLAASAMLLLFMTAVSWLAVCLGLLANSPDAANGYSFGLTFLPYLSSAFVPVHTMPGWLQAVADHQPITPIIETVRGLLMGTAIGTQAWLALAWFGAILVVGYVAATILFRRRTAR